MKHSIRVKFTMIFIGLMAAVLVSMWAVNSFFPGEVSIPNKSCSFWKKPMKNWNDIVM